MTPNSVGVSDVAAVNRTGLALLGDAAIWDFSKIAFLASDRFSADSVLKSYDWAKEMRRQNRCVISGFQSKLEKDVLEILLRGESPIILALSRGLYERPPAKYRHHVDGGRMLIISQFDATIGRPNRELARQRNEYIADVADEIVIAHIHEGGMLSRLSLPSEKKVTILDKAI
jgi:predicted Rossmann fold nucleotide-binding protein DprA/Smf involved in DNA uptake